MSDEIRCTMTDEVVCPHCGYVDGDSWEWFRDGPEEREIECPQCGKVFLAEAEYEVSYTSREIPQEGGEGE